MTLKHNLSKKLENLTFGSGKGYVSGFQKHKVIQTMLAVFYPYYTFVCCRYIIVYRCFNDIL